MRFGSEFASETRKKVPQLRGAVTPLCLGESSKIFRQNVRNGFGFPNPSSFRRSAHRKQSYRLRKRSDEKSHLSVNTLYNFIRVPGDTYLCDVLLLNGFQRIHEPSRLLIAMILKLSGRLISACSGSQVPGKSGGISRAFDSGDGDRRPPCFESRQGRGTDDEPGMEYSEPTESRTKLR